MALPQSALSELLDVACHEYGTTSLPRGWDHLEMSVSMLGLVRFVNGDALALPV